MKVLTTWRFYGVEPVVIWMTRARPGYVCLYHMCHTLTLGMPVSHVPHCSVYTRHLSYEKATYACITCATLLCLHKTLTL